jgi:hypothetical protein
MKTTMNNLAEISDCPLSIFSEAKSLQELFFVESRCEQELYLAARTKDWRELERLMPMYADLHLEIMMRLWKTVQPEG